VNFNIKSKNMKENFKLIGSSILVIFIAVCLALFVTQPKTVVKYGDTTSGYALNSTISGSVGVSVSTSTVVSLPDTARTFGYLCNQDPKGTVYINFSNYTSTATNTATAIGAAATSSGVTIFPSSCYTLSNQGNNTWAQINAIASSSATTTLNYMFGH